MARTSLPLTILAFLFCALAPCFAAPTAGVEKPAPTFEDTVRAALEDSRNNYQAVAGHLEHEASFGKVMAGLASIGIGAAIYFGAGAAYVIAPVPGLLMGAWMALSATKHRKVMQGWDGSTKRGRIVRERTEE